MILEAILLALSLCVDCFVVSACSSVSFGETTLRKIAPVAIVFGVIQGGLLLLGWLLGDAVVGLLGKVAKLIGFGLLLYVGISMIVEAIKEGPEDEVKNLHGLRNVIVASIATSIDALAVGASMPLSGGTTLEMWVDTATVALVTFLSVIAGMIVGGKLSERFGKAASIVGGCVLIAIGVFVLFR